MRVLVLDDEPFMAMLACSSLGQAGHDATASDGWASMAAEVTRLVPECLVVDWEMPGINGGSVVSALRNAGLLDGVRVVIFSGADEGTLLRAVADGVADAWAPKSSPAGLLAAVAG